RFRRSSSPVSLFDESVVTRVQSPAPWTSRNKPGQPPRFSQKKPRRRRRPRRRFGEHLRRRSYPCPDPSATHAKLCTLMTNVFAYGVTSVTTCRKHCHQITKLASSATTSERAALAKN